MSAHTSEPLGTNESQAAFVISKSEREETKMKDMNYTSIPRIVTSAEDLVGTIAEGALSKGTIEPITLDVTGLGYRAAKTVTIDPFLIRNGIKPVADKYIFGPILPVADRLVQAHQNGDIRGAQEALGILIRTRNQELAWAFEKVLNVRGTGCYGPILPDRELEIGCVGINPETAAALWIKDGDVVYFYRSPEQTARSCGESGALPVKVVVDHKYVSGCIYLNPVPVKFPDGTVIQTPKIAAGDFDGDCSALRVPHGEKAEMEARIYWVCYWDGAGYVKGRPGITTWKDEVGKPHKTDREGFDSKVRQKPSVPSLTTTGWALYTLALVDPEFPLSFKELIPLCFRILDAGMKLKHKATGAEIIMAALKPRKKLTVGIVKALEEQGYDISQIVKIRNYLGERGFKTANDAAAAKSLGFAVKTASGPDVHPAIEQFLAAAKEQGLGENIAKTYLDVVTGRLQLDKPTWVAPRQSVRQGNARIGSDFTVVSGDRLVVKCGLVRTEIPFDRKAQTVLWQGRTLIFRPIRFVSKWSEDGEPVEITKCASWGKLITELAKRKYSFVIRQIRMEPDPEEAQKLLDGLVRDVMKHVRTLFEVDDPGAPKGQIVNEWRSRFIRSQVMNMDLALPNAGMSTLVSSLVATTEAWIEEKGSRVLRYCDTLPGEPGRVLLMSGPDGRTVTEAAWPKCITRYIPDHRRPVLHASGNAADLAEPEKPLVSAGGEIQPDHIHVLAAMVPQYFLDASEMTPEAMHRARPVRRFRDAETGEVRVEELPGRPGMKVQCPIADVKSCVAEMKKKLAVRWADGTTTPVDMLFAYESEGHQMLTATQMTMAVYTVAKLYNEKTGKAIRVADDLTIERATEVAVQTGKYQDDTLTCELVDMETGETVVYKDEESGAEYSKFPVGYIPIITHRQHPNILSATKYVTETPRVYSGGCKADGPVHGGYPSIFHHQGLPEFLNSTFNIERVPADLVNYCQALAEMIEFDKDLKPTRAESSVPSMLKGAMSAITGMTAAQPREVGAPVATHEPGDECARVF